MKAICLMVVLLLTSFSVAAAQVNHQLEFYADEGLSSCELAMTTPGLVKVHMVVTGPGNLEAISFSAPKPSCMTNVTWIADVWQQPGMLVYVGNTQQEPVYGVEVIFACSPLPRYLGWIWFSVTGPAASCCVYGPQTGSGTGFNPFPGYLHVILNVCDPQLPKRRQNVAAAPKGLIVNPNESCRCDIPVSTRPITWGAIKALYR